MLRTSRPVAFLPSTDLDRSEGFFHDVLGLDLAERTPYACVFDLGSTTLRVTLVDDLRPQPFTVLGWVVADLRPMLRALRSAGVDVLRYHGMDQDEDGAWTTPGGDLVAWFADPDANVVSLTQLVGP